MLNIAVMVSGGGTNLQAVIDGIRLCRIQNTEIKVVISSQENAYALKRAEMVNIKTEVVNKLKYPSEIEKNNKIIEILESNEVEVIVLAGYMSIIDESIIKKYKNRIINIHPSLIPKYCGKGYYGIKVHEAVIKAKEKESGATVHIVDEGVDTGKILMQKKVNVSIDDDANSLAAKVLEVEHEILVDVLKNIEKSSMKILDNKN